ncbi:hypothetical protein AJ80_09037 [Polytolypa hystricis UAMH7299]|uniref:Uncharacterized protein n=1 Tax=Polytolypa hystricis (strain UAMH7299) TaxID=1447883 RepID=A0A2B7WXD6_POLH7|nr:hypothetical protein AJ80_09037 [Polytolypa hystricis UAMH7299]
MNNNFLPLPRRSNINKTFASLRLNEDSLYRLEPPTRSNDSSISWLQIELLHLNRAALQMIDIGTVELQFVHPQITTEDGSETALPLTNVLHASTSRCNILGNPIMDEYLVMHGGEPGSASRGSMMDTGRLLGPNAIKPQRIVQFMIKAESESCQAPAES